MAVALAGKASSMGARIYNLFPTLAGPMSGWDAHFERIAAMSFDWVYVNPIHRTGSSQSLYAVADYYELNPLLRGDDHRPADEILGDVVRAAGRRGLRLMLDLVINHTANDSPLTKAQPDWYRRDSNGRIVAPGATNPDDPTDVTVWEDLAELDYSRRPALRELLDYVTRLVRHHVRLGVAGFRCDAAYQVPGYAWSEIIAAARGERPDCVFAAETLGGSPQQVIQLAGAGFDYLFNSSKWWDFSAPWLMEQYERYRHVAPSIAFPESHDTPRLAAELAARTDAEIEAEYRFRYLFAALFSSGVMLPMGYEFGFSRALDVVRTRPEDWERPRFDISGFIGEVNAFKASHRALVEEGASEVIAGTSGGLALVRRASSSSQTVAVLIDPSRTAPAEIAASDLETVLGGVAIDVTPPVRAQRRGDSPDVIRLAPLEIRVYERADERASASKGSDMHQVGDLAQFGVSPASAGPLVIENVSPQIDGGRHPIKRIVGDEVVVEADVFREGHDPIAAFLCYRECGESRWRQTPMRPLGNDRWTASFPVARSVAHEYTVEGMPDPYAAWQHGVERKRAAGQPLEFEAGEGRALFVAAIGRSAGNARLEIEKTLAAIDAETDDDTRVDIMLSAEAGALAARHPDRNFATRHEPALRVDVDRRAAQFAAWYELFPRSAGTIAGRHGTFADVERRLPELRALGFDVIYLPPIHPIGHAHRKGRDNALVAGPDDVGSPWAIGNENGGHTAIEPALGDFSAFAKLVATARANALEIALDYALQCSPDHPWIGEHPEWFAFRPDGSIKYAENPPKKYQDIVNFDWFGEHRDSLWNALRDIVLFWIERGVRTFRVDNPHTKPFAFWEWMIGDVRARHPDTIFLAEAFTRPKVMNELAKVGFAQSYTYFTWRTTKAELTEYVTELATTEMAEFYRPHFWPNTPDILALHLQTGGRPAFRIRLVLAATLSSLYGVYSGYELAENRALPGREEYANSEKYEIVVRDYTDPASLASEIASINRIRRENPALHDWRNVTFYRADDDSVIFYGKRSGDNVLLVAVNLDPAIARDPVLWLPTGELGIADDQAYDIEELLGATKHVWRGSPHRWRLDPSINPAAIFRLTPRTTT
jgi:starch synthase (maltosyl-transferring)